MCGPDKQKRLFAEWRVFSKFAISTVNDLPNIGANFGQLGGVNFTEEKLWTQNSTTQSRDTPLGGALLRRYKNVVWRKRFRFSGGNGHFDFRRKRATPQKSPKIGRHVGVRHDNIITSKCTPSRNDNNMYITPRRRTYTGKRERSARRGSRP